MSESEQMKNVRLRKEIIWASMKLNSFSVHCCWWKLNGSGSGLLNTKNRTVTKFCFLLFFSGGFIQICRTMHGQALNNWCTCRLLRKCSRPLYLLSYEKAFCLGSARSHRNMFAMLGDVMKNFTRLITSGKWIYPLFFANVAIVSRTWSIHKLIEFQSDQTLHDEENWINFVVVVGFDCWCGASEAQVAG